MLSIKEKGTLSNKQIKAKMFIYYKSKPNQQTTANKGQSNMVHSTLRAYVGAHHKLRMNVVVGMHFIE